MKTLIVISRAHADTAFRLAEELHSDGGDVAVFFTGRGVHHISQPETLERLGFAELYTIDSEFDSPLDEVRAISYDEFIGLLEESERTFSWI
ncbi:DsrE family protein [Candidatus Bathyarchaeota archaeon]|nr:DsrE family protein [Candidatus Bathyarchaeota archaeon]